MARRTVSGGGVVAERCTAWYCRRHNDNGAGGVCTHCGDLADCGRVEFPDVEATV